TTLKIKFNNDKSASGNWTATIHKATSGGVDKYLQRTSFSAKQKSTSTASVKLKKGTYYLQLNPGYSNVQDLHYNFKLNATIPLKSFKLSKSKLSLVVGKTATLAVKSYSPGDTTSSKKAKWTSSNTAVASVSKGKVKAKGVGTTVITCTVAGVSKSCTVTIKPPTPVSKVSIKPKKVTLAVGQSVALKATVSPSKATNKTVSWKSSKKSVATVSKTGVVKAVKAGKATITVTTKDGKFKAKCKITVK
ncbi:MAG: Ig domain-containing protein, partial [Oscillospiraceae bacterium]